MGRRTGSPEMGAVLRHILSQKYISAPAACGNMVFYQTSASCIIQMIFFFQVNPRILHNPQTAPQGISFFKKGSYPFPRFHISFFRDHASVIIPKTALSLIDGKDKPSHSAEEKIGSKSANDHGFTICF